MSNASYVGGQGAAGGSSSPLVTVNQQGVQAINAIVAALKAFFPSSTGTSTTASVGSATLPATPAGFINITLPNGSQAKVAYYNV